MIGDLPNSAIRPEPQNPPLLLALSPRLHRQPSPRRTHSVRSNVYFTSSSIRLRYLLIIDFTHPSPETFRIVTRGSNSKIATEEERKAVCPPLTHEPFDSLAGPLPHSVSTSIKAQLVLAQALSLAVSSIYQNRLLRHQTPPFHRRFAFIEKSLFYYLWIFRPISLHDRQPFNFPMRIIS